MEQRPDSPIAGMPDSPEPSDEQVVHHVSYRKKRKKGVGGEEMELQMTSMIDVVFLLLIYFVITANFVIDEGTILATLPGNASDQMDPDDLDPPKIIQLRSTDDGVTYTLTVDGRPVDGVAGLYAEMNAANMKKNDPVQIKPEPNIRWQHVVNVYNACVRAELEQVGFAP